MQLVSSSVIKGTLSVTVAKARQKGPERNIVWLVMKIKTLVRGSRFATYVLTSGGGGRCADEDGEKPPDDKNHDKQNEDEENKDSSTKSGGVVTGLPAAEEAAENLDTTAAASSRHSQVTTSDKSSYTLGIVNNSLLNKSEYTQYSL